MTEPHATTLRHDDLAGRDSSNQIVRLMRLTLHVRIQENALDYFDSLAGADALAPQRRVERAQQLLTATSGALVDIALRVGFQTQAHFTTVFKRIVGNTHRQWRREPPDAA